MPNDVDELLRQRDVKYKSAWLLSGMIFRVPEIANAFNTFVNECPEFVYAWVIIVSKLFRILASPRDIDHWRDIAGYATLVTNELRDKE